MLRRLVLLLHMPRADKARTWRNFVQAQLSGATLQKPLFVSRHDGAWLCEGLRQLRESLAISG
jgi:hypothetical protein